MTNFWGYTIRKGDCPTLRSMLQEGSDEVDIFRIASEMGTIHSKAEKGSLQSSRFLSRSNSVVSTRSCKSHTTVQSHQSHQSIQSSHSQTSRAPSKHSSHSQQSSLAAVSANHNQESR